MPQRPPERPWLTLAIVYWTFAVTLARALRPPNDFARAFWHLDYRFGFTRRGLAGSLLSLASSVFGFAVTPRVIAIFSGLAAGALWILLLGLTGRMVLRKRRDASMHLTLLVFASSPFVVMCGHLFGYLDLVLYALAILAIALVLADRPLMAAALGFCGILVHESYLLVGWPLVALAAWRVCAARRDGRRSRRHAIALAIPLAAFAIIVVSQVLLVDNGRLHGQLVAYLSGFPLKAEYVRMVADYQTTSFIEFLRREAHFFDDRINITLAMAGLPLLAMLDALHRRGRLTPFGPASTMALAAICLPLVLHAIAWDTGRIAAYPLAGAFLGIWIFSETEGPAPDKMGTFALIALAALAMNIVMRVPLMDEQVDRFSGLGRLVLYAPAWGLALWIALPRGEWRRGHGRQGEPARAGASRLRGGAAGDMIEDADANPPARPNAPQRTKPEP